VTSGGFSEKGLGQLHDVMATHVQRGRMPGLIALVARRGVAHVEVLGTRAFGDPEAMGRDAIFRIASLTKPVVAAAALALVEEGSLDLDGPVDDLLPELANRRVLKSIGSDLHDTVAANRPITVEDLLTFRLGFGSIMAPPNTYPIQIAEAELHLHSIGGPPWPPTGLSSDQWIHRLGTMPLMYQPGERWMYNTGSQVLGVLLERATGKPLDTFLRERLFEPLGMVDTGFSVASEKLDRFTTAYAPDPETGALQVLDAAEDSWWSRPPAFPDASGWLVSTIDDYWAFVQMILNRGEYRGRRVLSELMVDLMTADHLTAEQRSTATLFLGEEGGWGLGLRVPAAGGAAQAIPGGFGWDGGSGTTWRSDVERGLTGILLTQRAMTSPEPPEVFDDFWTCAYQAINE
jgi:CubicO group peptidase (beta-lactamase class C family)